jgi:Tfp pilus assembly protein PilP
MLRCRALPLIALLLACSDSVPAPRAPTLPVSTSAAEPPSVLDTPEDVFSYVSAGRRDPFRIDRPDNEAQAPIYALQRWEIDELKLIGVVTSRHPVAMIEDPEGLGHTVQIGSIVGKNWGRVVRIADGEIRIRERRLVEWTGRRSELEISMR